MTLLPGSKERIFDFGVLVCVLCACVCVVCRESIQNRETPWMMTHMSVDGLCLKTCSWQLKLKRILPVYFGGGISTCRYGVSHTNWVLSHQANMIILCPLLALAAN